MVKYGGPRPVKAVISDVTASRALSTTYQNATGRPLLVIVTVRLERGAVASARACAHGLVQNVSPPTVHVCCPSLAEASNYYEIIMSACVLAVPPGYYYQVQSDVAGAGSTVILSSWIEVEL